MGQTLGAVGAGAGSDLEIEFAWQVRAAKLPAPQREVRFHPTRRWRFDFLWPDQRLAVEVEGGTWTGGRHSRGKAFEQDAVKYAEALLLGYRVLRVTTDMVHDGRALDYVERLLSEAA